MSLRPSRRSASSRDVSPVQWSGVRSSSQRSSRSSPRRDGAWRVSPWKVSRASARRASLSQSKSWAALRTSFRSPSRPMRRSGGRSSWPGASSLRRRRSSLRREQPRPSRCERVVDALSSNDDPELEGMAPDRRLLRVFDLAAVALRALAAQRPLAVLVDDLQWADEDSVRTAALRGPHRRSQPGPARVHVAP